MVVYKWLGQTAMLHTVNHFHRPAPAHQGRLGVGISDEPDPNIGALIFRIGFWSPLYYTFNKDPPKQYW